MSTFSSMQHKKINRNWSKWRICMYRTDVTYSLVEVAAVGAAEEEGEIQVWGEVVVVADPPLVVALLVWILISGGQQHHHVQVVEALESP